MEKCQATPMTAQEDNITMDYDSNVCNKEANLMLKYEMKDSYYGTVTLCEEHSDMIWDAITRMINVYDF